MRTVPAPLNERFVTPEMTAGPLPTAKVTGSPELAVAAKPSLFVVSCVAMAGKLIVCGVPSTVSVAVFSPANIAVSTCPVTV